MTDPTRLTLLASFVLTCLVIVGCQKTEVEGDGSAQVIRLAHGLPTTHPVHAAMEKMAESLAAKSAGAMRIEIYPAEQLGAERELLQLLQLGTLDIAKVSCMMNLVPAFL